MATDKNTLSGYKGHVTVLAHNLQPIGRFRLSHAEFLRVGSSPGTLEQEIANVAGVPKDWHLKVSGVAAGPFGVRSSETDVPGLVDMLVEDVVNGANP